jgi:hypothetical protein
VGFGPFPSKVVAGCGLCGNDKTTRDFCLGLVKEWCSFDVWCGGFVANQMWDQNHAADKCQDSVLSRLDCADKGAKQTGHCW